MMAARPAIASVNRASIAARSQPELETGTRPWSPPAIAATAATRALATASWARTMPASGAGSLIVLFQVLADGALAAHPLDQALVELPRGIHAAVAQQVAHRHDLGDHGDVLARIERHH